MKYVISFLILMGGIVGFSGVIFLAMFVCEKIDWWEWVIEHKYDRYRYFKHNILPWILMALMLCVLVFALTFLYLSILSYL